MSHFLARQHKPHLLWVPEWMRHANGATHIAAVTYVAEDPAPCVARLSRMFGPLSAEGEARTGQGVFRVIRPGDWLLLFGATPMPVLAQGEPAGAAIDVAVRDLSAIPAILSRAGVAACDTLFGLVVADVAACGNVAIRFTQAFREPSKSP